MGCGASAPSGPEHDYRDEAGPNGPVELAPAQLIVSKHVDSLYNGVYTRSPVSWNGKAVYTNSNSRYLYYYDANEGGTAGWSLDHRNQAEEMGSKDWYAGGYLPIEKGPAFPPLVTNFELAEVDGYEDQDTFVTITETQPTVPPAAIRIADHPDDDANGLYTLAGDLWNGRPHYHKADGWCFYYYAGNDGGEIGWALHPESVPNGAQDECEGGWVGPLNWQHPPLGKELGLNDVGRCEVHAESGDDGVAAQVHALMLQDRQQLMQSFGAVPVVMAQPVVGAPVVMTQPIMQQTTTTTTTTMMA